MRRFKDAYREEINGLPHIHIDAAAVGDEMRHRRMEGRRRKKQLWHTAAAALLFLLCGVGTATAVSYQRSTVEVTDNGYRSTNQEVPSALEGEASPAAASAVEKNVPVEGAAEPENVAEEYEAVLQEPTEYNSLEAFFREEDIAITLPEPGLLGGEPVSERVLLFEESGYVMLTLDYGDCSFSMSQQDYRDCLGYASSTAFSGEAVNERQLVSDQGLAYTMFDIMEEGEVISNHAVISVNGRELSFDFRGYEPETVEAVLKGLDFGVYFKED